MELWDLKNHIVAKTLPTPLIFIGEENKLIEIYVKKIFEVYNEEYFVYDRIADYIKERSNKGMVFNCPKIACAKYDNDIIKNEGLWKKLKNCILIYSELNKTTKFYKDFKDNIVSFDRMTEEQILQSLKQILSQRAIEIKDTYLNWLIQNCGKDYGRCLNELDKFLVFENANENLFKEMATNDVFHYDTQDVIFDFCNKFIDRKRNECLKLYPDLKLMDPPIVIISALYNQLRNIASIQLNVNPTEETTGLSSKQIYALKFKVNKFSNEALISMILQLSELDRNIKMGKVEDIVGLEQFLCRWL